MSRIAPAQAPYPPAVQSRLDRIMPPGAEPLLLFRTVARDERLFSRFMDGGFLDRGHLTLRQRELAILRVCANCRSEYEWGVHVAFFAERAGFTPDEVAATTQPLEDASWAAEDALVLRLCDALQDSCDLAEDFWSELREALSEMSLLELILVIGKYRQVALLTNALALPPEPGAARFPSSAP